MGLDLYLQTSDDSIASPDISRSFLREIINEGFIRFDDFLSGEETKVLQPNYKGEIVLGKKENAPEWSKEEMLDAVLKAVTGNGKLSDIEKMLNANLIISEEISDRERDPQQLRHVLKKLQQFMEEHADQLPLVHYLYASEENMIRRNDQDYVYRLNVKGIECHVEGDLYRLKDYPKHRNQIRIRSYGEHTGKVDFFVEVAPRIVIEGITYYSRTISKSDEFAADFRDIFDFLDKAIAQKKKVLWEFC